MYFFEEIFGGLEKKAYLCSLNLDAPIKSVQMKKFLRVKNGKDRRNIRCIPRIFS